MKKIAVRVGDDLWGSIAWYARQAGLLGPDGQPDISETVRDLLARGLNSDRSSESGYRSGYREGKLAGYSGFMRRVASPSAAPAAPAATRRK